MISLLKPAPAAPPLPDHLVAGEYRKLRLRVFAGIFIGYAGYYLVRKPFTMAIPDILKLESVHYTKADLGTAMTGLSVAYGLSKFLMGSVSDKSNPRWFLPLGLMLSASIIAAFGLFDSIYSSLWLIIALQTLNGWVGGMGWPPCGKTLVHWYSPRERGRATAIWNVAHNVGGALMSKCAVWGLAIFGVWQAKLYFNALAAAILAVLAWFLLRDTPQSCGLPTIEKHKNDYPEDYTDKHEAVLSFKEIFFNHVLNNGFLWAIAAANAFVYFVRYGIVDWVPTYFSEKGFTAEQGAWAVSVYELTAIPGTILCGYVSDRYFRGRRAPGTILFMIPTLLGVIGYDLNRHGSYELDLLCLGAIGFFIYGPVMLIGLHALELVPKKAAGTAAGFTGFFGYVFGSAIAGAGGGWLAQHHGWQSVFIAMIVCCLLTMAFSALTLAHKTNSNSR